MASVSKSSLNVSAAVTGAVTVAANSYVVITYVSTVTTPSSITSSGVQIDNAFHGGLQNQIITRYFGPSQSVPSTFTTTFQYVDAANTQQNGTLTWTLQSGVQFTNT